MRERIHPLNEEIEKEKYRAQKKQDESRRNMPPRKAAKGAKELGRHGLEPRLHAKAVKRPDDRVPRKAAAKGPKLVMGPHRVIATLSPNEGRTDGEGHVAKHS